MHNWKRIGFGLVLSMLMIIVLSTRANAQTELVQPGHSCFIGKLSFGSIAEEFGMRLEAGAATNNRFNFRFFYDIYALVDGSGAKWAFDLEPLFLSSNDENSVAMAGMGARMISVTKKYAGFYREVSKTETDLILYGTGSVNFGQPEEVTFNISLRPGILLSTDSDGDPFWIGLDMNICVPNGSNKLVINAGASGREHLYEFHLGFGLLFIGK